MSRAPRTTAVHAGRGDLTALGFHAPPIDLSSTYPITSISAGTASLDEMATGGEPMGSSIYGRLHNPTVARVENAIATLEGTESAVAFASGMAAMTACLMAAKMRGSHVVAIRPLYGGTDHLLACGLLGLDVSFVTAEEVAGAIGPATSLVILETPTNPICSLTDIEAVVAQAGDVPVLVDNTFATPVLQNPARHGATYVLHSATKALGGHGDVIAGMVACDEEHARALRQVRILTGGILNPHAAYLLHRGLQTLAIRVNAAQENAMQIARLLSEHPAVASVRYPGLPGQDPRGLIGRQMRGPGSVLAFELVHGYDAAEGVMKSVDLITPAVSLGTTDTLIEHPAGLTHRVVEPEALASSGITPSMLRLSVGIEDVSDIWDDLRHALDLVS